MRKILILMTLFLTVPLGLAQSAEVESFGQFAKIPVLDGGRLKPLDTYARSLLVQFSGKDTYNKKSALSWLAALIFLPESTRNDTVFLINNPDVAQALSIPVQEHRRYSFAQLEPGLTKLADLAKSASMLEQKNRSIVEEEIIRVNKNILIFADLSNVMLFAINHPDFSVRDPKIAALLGIKSKEACFLDIIAHARELHEFSGHLENTNRSQWKVADEDAMILLSNVFHWSMSYKEMPMALIPMPGREHTWLSPWDSIPTDFKNESTRRMLFAFKDMLIAYRQGQQVPFDMAVRQYLSNLEARVSENEARLMTKFPLENAYHALMPFLLAKLAYIITFLFFIVSFISKSPIWYRFGWGAILIGFIPHVAALIARIIIMNRPPVSSLYETFIFVGAIGVFLGMLIERYAKQWLGLLVAAVSGAAMLFIAFRYSSEGDTMQMLVAVLNSNFWLATHVTTITMGYAATCVAGILGHIWLIQAAFRKNKGVLNNTYCVMVGILGLSLALTFLGTNLGGIWADQSWGRFWGWDPKENGALMIVLWSAMLFHARFSNFIGEQGMAVGNVLGMMVVMWAWFGVNLLSIGLHSYGFTSGIATSLAIYYICELLFIAITVYFASRKALDD